MLTEIVSRAQSKFMNQPKAVLKLVSVHLPCGKTIQYFRKIKNRKCDIPGCGRPHSRKGLCQIHFKRKQGGSSVPMLAPISTEINHAGDKNGRWRGGEINDGHGRILIYSPGHPNPSSNGTHVYRYRLVMEKSIGRYLASDEIIHHKNGNHSDDRLENLQIVTRSQHCKIHWFGHKI